MDDPKHFFPFDNVPDDVPCLGCGYDLRHQPVTGVCPECGYAVSTSVRRSLFYANRNWLGGIRHGGGWLIGGSTLVFLAFLAVSVGLNSGSRIAWSSFPCALVLAWFPYSVGSAMITSLEPSSPRSRRRDESLLEIYPVICPMGVVLFSFLTLVFESTGQAVLTLCIIGTIGSWPLLVDRRLSEVCGRAYDPVFRGWDTLFRLLWWSGMTGAVLLVALSEFGVGGMVFEVGLTGEFILLTLVAMLHILVIHRARRILKRAMERPEP